MSSTGYLSPLPNPQMPIGGGNDQLFYMNGQVMTVSYTLPAGQSAMMVGPLTINPGLVLTIPSGCRLVVL